MIAAMQREEAQRMIREHRAELDALGVRSLAIFGSVARGEAGPDSDYDFLVVVKRKVSRSKKEQFVDKRWNARLFEATDVVIWTKKSFEELSQLRTSLPATVIEEGKLLYEAA